MFWKKKETLPATISVDELAKSQLRVPITTTLRGTLLPALKSSLALGGIGLVLFLVAVLWFAIPLMKPGAPLGMDFVAFIIACASATGFCISADKAMRAPPWLTRDCFWALLGTSIPWGLFGAFNPLLAFCPLTVWVIYELKKLLVSGVSQVRQHITDNRRCFIDASIQDTKNVQVLAERMMSLLDNALVAREKRTLVAIDEAKSHLALCETTQKEVTAFAVREPSLDDLVEQKIGVLAEEIGRRTTTLEVYTGEKKAVQDIRTYAEELRDSVKSAYALIELERHAGESIEGAVRSRMRSILAKLEGLTNRVLAGESLVEIVRGLKS